MPVSLPLSEDTVITCRQVHGTMKLMVSDEDRALKSSEISSLIEKAKRGLSPPACYPGYRSQIISALLWVGTLIIFRNAFTSTWNFAGEHFSWLMGPSVPNQEPRHRVHQKQGSGTEYLKLENLGFMVSYPLCVEKNSSLLIGMAERRGEVVNLTEEGKAVSSKFSHQCTMLPWVEHWAPGNAFGAPLDEYRFASFRPVDISLWEWYFSPAGKPDTLFVYMRHLEYVAFLRLGAFFALFHGWSYLLPWMRQAQEECSLPLSSSLWRYQALHLCWAWFN